MPGDRMLFRAFAPLILACAALAGCGTMASGLVQDRDLYLFEGRVDDVEFGMSKTRVQQIMGTPKNRVYQGNQEAWLWCQTSTSPKVPDAYLTVYFHNAQVAGIHTYGNRAEGTCENFFKRVEWLADPEKSLAARQKRRG
jgi:outer membrane protein assembly factor BamE (lipoprotein component of BamABCDE complex)